MKESRFIPSAENGKMLYFEALVPRPDLVGEIVFFKKTIKALNEDDAREKIRLMIENDYKSFDSDIKDGVRDREYIYKIKEKLAKMEIEVKKLNGIRDES
jgi:hypothetical protein